MLGVEHEPNGAECGGGGKVGGIVFYFYFCFIVVHVLLYAICRYL